VLFTLDIRSDGSWRQAEHFITTTAPAMVQVGTATVQVQPPPQTSTALTGLIQTAKSKQLDSTM